MRKFVIKYRQLECSILEVEVKAATSYEDPSVMWLANGEWKGIILEPKSLWEKQPNGELAPPIYYWHAFYDSEEEALERAKKDIRSSLELKAFKSKYIDGKESEFSEEEFLEACSKIKVIKI